MRLLRAILSVTAALLCASLSLYAQGKEQTDSLVRLISAASGHLDEIDGESYRMFIGEATFLHNDTYLICDTAKWNVDRRIINAVGNVRIIQDKTYLTSERADYIIDENLAKFRGSVVQLRDKDDNVLRTRHLDYNTRDSVAVFENGAAMRSKDGQIIESRNGSYDSKDEVFTFVDEVNMFSDSVFVKTTRLIYRSPLNMAYFGHGTDAWSGDNMLSADDGWYDRAAEVFFFRDDVHVMSETQEGWSDSLYYHRLTSSVEMIGNAVVTDTVRNVTGLGGRIEYVDSLSRVTMTVKPAVIAELREDEKVDTVYFGADTLIYRTFKKFELDSAVFAEARLRKESLAGDPVTEYRAKAAKDAAEAAAAAQAEADKNDPNKRFELSRRTAEAVAETVEETQEEVSEETPEEVSEETTEETTEETAAAPVEDEAGEIVIAADSLGVRAAAPVLDSLGLPLQMPGDSLFVPDVPSGPLDSTEVGFMTAINNVKMFRRDMQFACDSLVYNDLDSLARLYKNPVIWNEPNRQYYADSIAVILRNNSVEKANLMSSAFVVTEEKENMYYDQIKGAELVAYFDGGGTITRFDALGGASAIFYLKEHDELATVNRIEGKMLHAEFVDGEIDRFYFFEQPKNNFMPIVQMKSEEHTLSGFHWDAEKRPSGKDDITPIKVRESQRLEYESHPRAKYKETDIYFPGYMDGVYRQIALNDSLKLVRKREQKRMEEEMAEKARLDSLINAGLEAIVLDSLVLDDFAGFPVDSVSAVSDSSAVKDSVKTVEPDKATNRKAAREARWAEKDRKDAERQKAREAARIEKRRKATLAELKKRARQAEKEKRAFERYKARYEKQKAREDAKQKTD